MYYDNTNLFDIEKHIATNETILENLTNLIYLCANFKDTKPTDVVFENEVFYLDNRDWICTCERKIKLEKCKKTIEHSKSCVQTITAKKINEYINKTNLPTTLTEYTLWLVDVSQMYEKILKQTAEESNLTKITPYTCTCDYYQNIEKQKKKLPDHNQTCKLKNPNFLYKPKNVKLYWRSNKLPITTLDKINKQKTSLEITTIINSAITSITEPQKRRL